MLTDGNSCDDCPPGYFTNDKGREACTKCPAGTFSEQRASRQVWSIWNDVMRSGCLNVIAVYQLSCGILHEQDWIDLMRGVSSQQLEYCWKQGVHRVQISVPIHKDHKTDELS